MGPMFEVRVIAIKFVFYDLCPFKCIGSFTQFTWLNRSRILPQSTTTATTCPLCPIDYSINHLEMSGREVKGPND